MGASFDRVAHCYDETRGGVERGNRLAEVVDGLLVETEAILELGVGTGLVASAMRSRGRRVVGVDISHRMLLAAAPRIPGLVARADATQLPIADQAMAGVYAVWVLHLVDDQPALFAEVARVLRPGGRFVILPTNRPPESGDDPIAAVAAHLFDQLNNGMGGRDGLDRLSAAAAHQGLEEVESGLAAEASITVTGNQVADRIEQRAFSALWNVSEVDWESHVVPAIAQLRALGDQQFSRVLKQDVLVLRKPSDQQV